MKRENSDFIYERLSDTLNFDDLSKASHLRTISRANGMNRSFSESANCPI